MCSIKTSYLYQPQVDPPDTQLLQGVNMHKLFQSVSESKHRIGIYHLYYLPDVIVDKKSSVMQFFRLLLSFKAIICLLCKNILHLAFMHRLSYDFLRVCVLVMRQFRTVLCNCVVVVLCFAVRWLLLLPCYWLYVRILPEVDH